MVRICAGEDATVWRLRPFMFGRFTSQGGFWLIAASRQIRCANRHDKARPKAAGDVLGPISVCPVNDLVQFLPDRWSNAADQSLPMVWDSPPAKVQ